MSWRDIARNISGNSGDGDDVSSPSDPPGRPSSASPPELESKQLARLQREAQQLRTWLAKNKTDRKGAKVKVRLSNRTDNESAKMATSKGVIQLYRGGRRG